MRGEKVAYVRDYVEQLLIYGLRIISMTVSSSWCQGLRIILIERRRKKGVRLHKAAVYVRAVGCVRLRDCSLVMLLLGLRCIERGEGGRSSFFQ